MKGGAILGEGVDGCVLANPMWPCASDGAEGRRDVPSTGNASSVSKIVRKSDQEDATIRLAMSILGPEMSRQYLAPLRGTCAPANEAHPPPRGAQASYRADKAAVLGWQEEGKACGELKKQLKEGKGIHDTHKVMYIERYPDNLFSWMGKQKGRPPRQVVMDLQRAVRPFLTPLQKLSATKFYNIDLHNQNIFVRPQKGGGISFGIADFGHTLIGASAGKEYLEKYIQYYEFWYTYNQVPIEARLLNFCFQKNLDSVSPRDLMLAWRSDKNLIFAYERQKDDALMFMLDSLYNTLMASTMFITMVSNLQDISRSLRAKGASATQAQASHKVILDFILSRYMIVSPINSIIQSATMVSSPTRPIGTEKLLEFYRRLVLMPYSQVGSSLLGSLEATMSADVSVLWDDVLRGA